ncbi:carbohydrate-binding family 9-like protein [Wenyingzhuangia sp. IMCC45533]
MKFNIILFALLATITVTNGQTKKLDISERPLYKNHKANSAILVDGKLDDTAWGEAEVRTFEYFYLTQNKKEEQKTTFRMLWDDQNIYLFYESDDKYVNAAETKRDGAPYLDDCAEVFFIPAPQVENIHYCFEVNVNEAKNDLVWVNNFERNNNAVIKQYNPEFKVAVKINGTLNNNTDVDKGWSMEMAIPHDAFKGATNLHPIQLGNKWAFIALRQFRDVDEIGRRAMTTLFPVYHIEKDVHQPEMFGLMEFVE